jgi:hypothetical protein
MTEYIFLRTDETPLAATPRVVGDIASVNYSAATEGFFLDSATGDADFSGNVTMGGSLIMTGGLNNLIATAESGSRIEIGPSATIIRFYSGSGLEIDTGFISVTELGNDLSTFLASPETTAAGVAYLEVRSDGTGGGSTTVVIASDVLEAQGVYDDNTGGAANVAINSLGVIKRSSSIEALKDIDRIVTIGDEVFQGYSRVKTIAFRSLCKGDDPDRIYLGSTAEDVAANVPELAIFNLDGVPDGVAYSQFSVLNKVLIEDLQDRVDLLEEKVWNLGL